MAQEKNSETNDKILESQEIISDSYIPGPKPSIQRENGEITLHIKYIEPINFNGFNVENDTITFDNLESLEAYANGKATYDTLDNAVHKRENEILLYAENERGEIVWGKRDEKEVNHGDNVDIKNPYNESNFKIQPTKDGNGFIVRSDSERFGENAVVFQGLNYQECLQYISDRSDNIEPSYYVIKDLASWRSDVWEAPPQMSAVERFSTVDEAIARFNEYRAMDYLKQEVVDPQTKEPMRRLALGVSYNPHEMAEMDLLQVQGDKTLLISDAISERENGYERFMTNKNFIRDLNKITSNIEIDEYSYYRDSTIEDLVQERREHWDKNYPNEAYPEDEILDFVQKYVQQHPNYLSSNKVNERIPFKEFTAPFFERNLNESNHRDNEVINQDEIKSAERDPIVASVSEPVKIDSDLPVKEQLKLRLENGIRQVLDSEQFKNWLATGGKLFYNTYSFRNAMLVWLQKPQATYVMGYEQWKDFGRNVRQGATGAKILVPRMAYEKYKGGLFRTIKNSLMDQFSKNPALTEASYQLGTSNLEFTMNRSNHLIGLKVGGQECGILGSDEEVKRFISRAVIGKVPTGFSVRTVFDVQDVIIPEYLWVKSGYTKDEIVPDEKGRPIKNRDGEVKIYNTPERQARFQTQLDLSISEKDPAKMQVLFDACIATSERKGVPVALANKADDDILANGAKGYFSREVTNDKPNGYIVIDNSLEITEKCAVILHEMGHADLHKNLDELAKAMGEQKVTKEMREVQAEATAFSVASTFGIETDTSSFGYLASFARGFELQDFQKSLDVIYRETQSLTREIQAELDIRGLNLDLTEKPKAMLDKQTLETLSTRYVDFATEQGNNVQAAYNELPTLIKTSANNPELMDVLKYMKENLDSRKADLDIMLTAIEQLNTVDTRDAQDEALKILEAADNRIKGNSNAFEQLSERYVILSEQARGGLKVSFDKKPLETLEAMKKDYPALAKLSDPQLQYIGRSKFIAHEFSKLLRTKPQEFVDKAINRAALISKAASKNGTFVEINFCEQWTDKPFFEYGTLCSPKIADKTVAGCEKQTRTFSQIAEKRGEYFPYTKCDMTIFTPDKEGKLISLNTRVNIGDGSQTSLKDHLEKLCQRGSERKELLANFNEALSERADKRKLIVPDLSDNEQHTQSREKNIEIVESMTQEDWSRQINETKEQSSNKQQIKGLDELHRIDRDRVV